MGFLRHLSEQYFTCGQSRAHFFLQTKGLPHVKQIFCGKSDFFLIGGIRSPVQSSQKRFGDLVVYRHFLAQLLLHLDHHRHARIAGKELRMAVNESPVKSIPDRTPSPFFVVAHFQNVTAPTHIRFCGHTPTVSVLTHYDSIQKGIIDFRDILYFVVLISFWLYANVITIESKKAD